MKKISLLILMLTFLLIPTCVNANAVSWEDFVAEVQKTTDRNVEEDLNNFSGLSTFKSQYNSCYAFYVFGNFGFTSDSPDNVGADKLYFYLVTDTRNGTSVLFNSNGSAWNLSFRYYNSCYTYDLETGLISGGPFYGSNKVYITYNLNEQNQSSWSAKKFNSETGLNYFLTTSYVLGWNATAVCNYYTDYPDGNTNITKDLTSLNDSDWPWEDTGTGGVISPSGDIYYNYDFIGPMSQPYLFKPTDLSFLGSNSGDGVFGLKILIGDTNKYPINDLFLDLEVYEVSQTYQVKLVNTYKNYFGNYLNAENYISKSTGPNDTTYTYNLIDTFNREFLSPYFEDIDTYCFTIKLYDKNYKVLSKIDLVYFGIDNNLNNFESMEDYYNPPYGNGNLNLDSYDFTSILDTTKNFLSSVFGVFVIFPDWLVYLLAFGITVAVILRILGR